MNFDLVITLSQGESFVTHHAILNTRCFHDKWMSYIHDPYPMAYYPESYKWKSPGTNQKINFMRSIFDESAFLSFPSLKLSEWMSKYYYFDKSKVRIIPHQISNSLKTISNLQDDLVFNLEKFNLLYAGNLLKQRNPFPLIKAFENLCQKYPEKTNKLQLTIIGPTSSVWLEELSKKICDTVKYYPTQEFKHAFYLQKMASVNVIIESNDEESPFLPAKFPHCILTQKPILLLGPNKSETLRILGEDYSFYSRVDDVDSILLVLEKLFFDWENKKEFNYDEGLIDYLGDANLKAVIETIF